MAAIFDPSIFTQGAQLRQQEKRDMFSMLSGAIQQYQKGEELQQAKLEKQRQEANKPENILAAKIAGQPTTPEQDALLEAYNVMQQSKMAQNPVTGELYTPYRDINQVLRGGGSQPMSPAQVYMGGMQNNVPTPTMGGSQLPFPNIAEGEQYAGVEYPTDEYLPPVTEDMVDVDPTMVQRKEETPSQKVGTEAVADELIEESGLKGTPIGRKMLLESGIRINEKSLEKEIDFAKEQLKSEKGKGQINKKIAELVRINNELQKEGALMGEKGGIKNLLTMATGTGLGGAAEAAVSPKTAQLRKDYENAVGGIIPYYIAANNLPATVVDTEEFAQRIINAFGNPSGFYGTNVEALRRASEEFGGSQQPQQQNDPLGLF